MTNYSGLSGGIYQIAEWVMKFTLINLCWLLLNAPIGLLLLNILLLKQKEGLLLMVIPLVIMLPLLLFPATTAMFAVVRDWIIKSNESDKLFRTFFRYYKENYLRSLTGGVVFTILWVIFAIDVYYLFDMHSLLFFLFMTLGIILYVMTLNFFSVTVHYHLSFLKALKHTFFISLGSPLLFIGITISSGLILYASINVPKYLLAFFTFSLIAFFAFAAFYRFYLSVATKHE